MNERMNESRGVNEPLRHGSSLPRVLVWALVFFRCVVGHKESPGFAGSVSLPTARAEQVPLDICCSAHCQGDRASIRDSH